MDERGLRDVGSSALEVWGLAPIGSCAAAVDGDGDAMGRGDEGGPGGCAPRSRLGVTEAPTRVWAVAVYLFLSVST